MIDKGKLARIIEKMKEAEMPQMIITDPVAIFYLTGVRMHPLERLLVLYLHTNGNHHILINKLFQQKEDLGVPITYYDDTEDGVEILTSFMEKDKPMGIDKQWTAKFLLRLMELCPGCKLVNGSVIVDKVRQIKDKKEQEFMIRSSEINDEVMGEVISWVAKGLTEEELCAKTEEIYKAHGIEKLAFPPITAYGKSGTDPHHENDKTCASTGDGVLIDIGGIYENYCSDMTRTVFIGKVSHRQREIYNIVLEANRRGIAAAKPGNKMKDVDLAARSYIEEMGYGKYFTHRTGHSIGLEDHEVGDVSSVNDEVIEIGQCFSVEPGIYIPEEGIGVRIEDLVLITEDGCRVLNHFPKELIVVPES